MSHYSIHTVGVVCDYANNGSPAQLELRTSVPALTFMMYTMHYLQEYMLSIASTVGKVTDVLLHFSHCCHLMSLVLHVRRKKTSTKVRKCYKIMLKHHVF